MVSSLYLWLVAVCLVGFGAISPFVVIVVFVALLHRRKSTGFVLLGKGNSYKKEWMTRTIVFGFWFSFGVLC